MDPYYPHNQYQMPPNNALNDVSNFPPDFSPPRYRNDSPVAVRGSATPLQTPRTPVPHFSQGPYAGSPSQHDPRVPAQQLPPLRGFLNGQVAPSTPAPARYAAPPMYPPGLPIPAQVRAQAPGQGRQHVPQPATAVPTAGPNGAARPSVPAAPAAPTAPAVQPPAAAARAPAPAAGAPPAPAQAADGAPKPKKGPGSRSGTNRRNAGASDDEVMELSAADLAQAGVTARETTKKKKKKTEPKPPAASTRAQWSEENSTIVVDKITSPEVWPNFKLNQAIIFDELVGKLAAKRFHVTREQIRNHWNSLWSKYKQARRVSEVTGGAGDVESRDPDAETDAETDSDGDSNQAGKKRKRKAKKDDDDDDEDQKPMARDKALEFAKTAIYKKIDDVAHDDPDVVRGKVFSSGAPIKERSKPYKRARTSKGKKKSKKKKSGSSSSSSDSETSSSAGSDSDDVGHGILKIFKERSKRQARIDKENLALSEERNKHDAERLRIEREKHEREEWAEYERCKASPDPVLQRRAELLAKRLLGDA